MNIYKYYKIYCNTENLYVNGWSLSTPTTCYNDEAHIVNLNSVQQIEENAEYVIIRDQRNSGVNGDDISKGLSTSILDDTGLNSEYWYDRKLNNITASGNSVTLNGDNTFTLIAGTYYLKARAASYKISNNRLRLYDTTNSSVYTIGESNDGNTNVVTWANLETIISISSPTTYLLQHYTRINNRNNAFGRAVGSGDNEIYATVIIQKLNSQTIINTS